MSDITDEMILELIIFLNNEKSNIFDFLGIQVDEILTEEKIFTHDFKRIVKKAFNKNCIKFHPDKNIGMKPDELATLLTFNLLSKTILTKKDVYYRYNEMNELYKQTRTFEQLRSDYKSLNRSKIKELINETTQGQTYEQIAKKQNEIHLQNGNRNEISQIEIEQALEEIKKSNYKKNEELKVLKKDEYKIQFNQEFEKQFENKTEIQTNTEIQAYNIKTNGLGECISCNGDYNILYATENNIDDSFKLISSEININQKEIKRSYKDALDEYNKITEEIKTEIKKIK